MTTAAIRQKLYEYIRIADEKKVKAIFTIVEDDIGAFDWKNDKAFLAESDKRSDDYKSGKVNGMPWDDVKTKILASRKDKK